MQDHPEMLDKNLINQNSVEVNVNKTNLAMSYKMEVCYGRLIERHPCSMFVMILLQQEVLRLDVYEVSLHMS